MKKKSLRILSLIVAIVMVVAMLPLSALAGTTAPKQKVALVVYGAEFTQLIAKSNDLNDLQKLAEDFVAEGASVPTVKATLTGKGDVAGEKVTLTEATESDDRNLFSSLQTSIPVVEAVSTQLTDLGDRIFNKITDYDVTGIADRAKTKYNEFKSNSVTSTQNIVDKVMDGVFTNLQLYGSVYRVYVGEVPEGTYDLFIDEFGKDDGSVQAGYVLFDDGTDDNKFNSKRLYEDVEVTLQKDGRTQYLGNQNVGLVGTIPGLDYVNKFNAVIEEFPIIKTVLSALKIELKEIDTSFSFIFPGLWCAESDAGFTFKNTDIVDNALTASSFMMVDREELVNVLKTIVDLGKDTIKEVMKAAFDEEYDGYDNLVQLHLQLVNSDEGQMSINSDKLFEIVKVYMAVISNVGVVDRLVDTHTGSLLTPFKLKVQLPAILQATADEAGLVTFNRQSNITLVWILKLLPMMKNVAASALEQTGVMDKMPKVLTQLLDYADQMAGKTEDEIAEFVNGYPYALAQRFGIVGPKMQDDHYIMLQVKAPVDIPQEGKESSEYWLNPLAYTMDVTWKNADWAYVTLADLGIITPYVAEGLYDFVRNTTFEGTVDAFLAKVTRQDDKFVTRALTGDLDVTAALTAYITANVYGPLGLDNVFANKSEFLDGLNEYLYNNGRTTQNLMVYLNKQAKKAKAVYAGNLNPLDEEGNPLLDANGERVYWQFYNVDKSLTIVATKLIKKSADDLAGLIAGDNKVSETKKDVISKTGSTVATIVEKVGTKIEATTAKVTSQIASAAKSVASKLFSSAVSSVKTVATSLFSNIGKLFSKSMITFNA